MGEEEVIEGLNTRSNIEVAKLSEFSREVEKMKGCGRRTY